MSLKNLADNISINWSKQVMTIRAPMCLRDVQIAMKNSMFSRTKLRVVILNHSFDYLEQRRGAPTMPRLVLDVGWKIIGADYITDAKHTINWYDDDTGETICQHVFERIPLGLRKPIKIEN